VSKRRAWSLLFYWLPFILWLAWVFYWSSRPRLPRPNRRVGLPDHTFEFWAHAFSFAVLTVLSWRMVRYVPWLASSLLGRAPLLTASLFTALYGASDEWHQSWVPGRWPSMLDWRADMLGVAIALGLLLLWGWVWQRWGLPAKERLNLPAVWR
jgi:VanZ family protein